MCIIRDIKLRLDFLANLAPESLKLVQGCAKHNFRLGRRYTKIEVSQIEVKYSIKFPEKFVEFITQLGMGGAGPGYGLLSLDNALSQLDDDGFTCKERLNQTCKFTSSNLKRLTWLENIGGPNWGDNYNDELWTPFSGLLAVSDFGCTCYDAMPLNGDLAGRVLQLTTDVDETLPPKLTKHKDFLSYYDHWLEGVVQGNSVDWTVYRDKSLRLAWKTEYTLLSFRNDLSAIKQIQNLSASNIRSLTAKLPNELNAFVNHLT